MTIKDTTPLTPSKAEAVAPKTIGTEDTQEIIDAIRRIMDGDAQELLNDNLEPARLSQAAQNRIYQALGRLTGTSKQPPTVLEVLVMEVLQPHIADWLERNLPPLVERMVRQELREVVGSAYKIHQTPPPAPIPTPANEP